MRLIIRVWNLCRGISGRVISTFERRNPEALLELEKENLRVLIGRFNEGLVSHAALSERMMTQVRRGEREHEELTARIRALVRAGNGNSAARYALQLKQVATRLAEDRKQLETAEKTYRNLLRTRDASVAETRMKIEEVGRQISDLKVKQAIADLEGMATAMVGEWNEAGDSFNRLREMVQEEREKATARVRVAESKLDATDLAMREAEQEALASQALEEFLAGDGVAAVRTPLAIEDLSIAAENLGASAAAFQGGERS